MLARKLILGFGFAVLMPLLIHYGVDVIAPREKWGAISRESAPIQRQISELRRQEREAASEAEKSAIRKKIDRLDDQLSGLREGQQARREQTNRIHFFIGVPLGILVTLAGSFIRAQAIGGGLMLGGIFTFSNSCWGYWSDLPAGGRFLILLVAFVELMWIGYQRLSELKQPAKPA